MSPHRPDGSNPLSCVCMKIVNCVSHTNHDQLKSDILPLMTESRLNGLRMTAILNNPPFCFSGITTSLKSYCQSSAAGWSTSLARMRPGGVRTASRPTLRVFSRCISCTTRPITRHSPLITTHRPTSRIINKMAATARLKLCRPQSHPATNRWGWQRSTRPPIQSTQAIKIHPRW